MKDDSRNYVIVGGFVIAMLLMLATWIALLSGRSGATDDYSIVYRNVMGLETGVEILYEGFAVGLIESIEPFDRDGVRSYRVGVSVRRGWPIPDDSVAAITAPGLLSSVVIDIRTGSSEVLLSPGSEIPGEEAADVLAAVNRVAAETMRVIQDDVAPLLQDLGARAPDILDHIEQTTAALDQAAVQLSEILGPTNAGRVSRILGNMEGASSDTGTLIADLSTTKQQVDELVEKLDRLVVGQKADMAEAMEALNHSLAALARHADAVAANLDDTARNLSELSRQVRNDPSLLIRGRESDEETP